MWEENILILREDWRFIGLCGVIAGLLTLYLIIVHVTRKDSYC